MSIGKIYKKYGTWKIWKYFFIDVLVWSLGPAISLFERPFKKKYGTQPLKHQPVFIIGAPRTGSTFLYQCITNQFDVVYIDNLAAIFFRNLFFGLWLSNKIFKGRAHNCFKSYHGNTQNFGYHAPSECGQFWYRWLPKNKHFVDHADVTENMIRQIGLEIRTAINYFDKPIVINNNNIALRIRLIKRIFPDAKYIVADRNPVDVAQSIIVAKQKILGGGKEWWSIIPPNVELLRNKNGLEQAVYQHYFINKQMYQDLKSFISLPSYTTIYYDEFLSNVNHYMTELQEIIGTSKTRGQFEKSEVTVDKRWRIAPEEKNLLMEIINALDWKGYSSEIEG